VGFGAWSGRRDRGRRRRGGAVLEIVAGLVACSGEVGDLVLGDAGGVKAVAGLLVEGAESSSEGQWRRRNVRLS